MSAKFKTLPNYEYIKDGLHIVFNGEGCYETNEEAHIKALESAKPFIQRVDVEEKPKEKSPKKQQPKKPVKKDETK